MNRILTLGFALAATGVAVVTPSAAFSQDVTPNEKVATARVLLPGTALQQADVQTWSQAGADGERAARLNRPATDVHFQHLWTAAHQYYYAGDVKSALRLMLETGELSLARGDVANAADLYFKSIHLAVERGEHELAAELRDRLALLAHSPILPAADRETLNTRLSGIE